MKRFDQAKPFATLGIVVLVWLLLPVAVKTFTRATFFELTSPIEVAASYVRDLQQYWSLRLHSNQELIEAGRDAAHAAAYYEFSVQQNSELRAEIERLENLLRLPSFPEYRYEHARVANRDFNGWWQRITIRKGRNFGIPVDAPVVFTGGVVGRVTEVHATTSIVELISSPNVRLAAVVEGDPLGRPVTFQGGVNPTLAPPMGVVELLPLDIIVAPNSGTRLITSGLGGVFPLGLTIGRIAKVDPSNDGMFRTGEVRLDERLGSLAEVTVLVPLATDDK
jgi:rod shape-determining protein MreC